MATSIHPRRTSHFNVVLENYDQLYSNPADYAAQLRALEQASPQIAVRATSPK